MMSSIDDDTLLYFQEICEDKYFSANYNLSELRSRGLAVLKDKGVLVKGRKSKEIDESLESTPTVPECLSELELNYFIFFKDNLDLNEDTLTSLLSLTRLLINEVGEIRSKHPNTSVSTDSIWKTYRTIQGIASKIRDCHRVMSDNGDSGEFNYIYKEFMLNELKVDKAHKAAALKVSKEALFLNKSFDIMTRYTKTYNRVVALNKKKESEDRYRESIVGGIITIFFGELDNTERAIETSKRDLDFLKKAYYRIYMERKDVFNDEISSKLREEIQVDDFDLNSYIDHYTKIITQFI